MAVVRRIILRTLCVMALLAWLAFGSAARSAERVTSELMPVDFMQAVTTEGGVQPAFGPTTAFAEPPALPPVEAIAPPPADSTPLFSERVVACVPSVAWMESRTCPQCQPWTRGYRGSNYGEICTTWDREINGLTFDGLVRGYYINDQRIEWSGVESTMAAESILIPRIVHNVGNWTIAGNSVFFINEPFDRNLYVTPERQSYAANFQIPPFQIWNLNVSFTCDDFRVSIGKDNNPFGRYYFPLFTNSRMDAPFIRTEAINWVETGIFMRYTPSIFSFDAALVNGGVDADTNSSKSFIGRAGINLGWLVCGASVKVGDGIGSEFQKEWNNLAGADAMVRWGQFDLSGEVIYNQYGFRKPFNPNNIFWGRSIYYRDLYSGTIDQGLHGVGYYLNAGYTFPRLRLDLNYGGFYPHAIGNPLADTPTQRGFAKYTWSVMSHFEQYTMVMFENARPAEAWRSNEKPFAFLTGFQTYF